jgi:hypothetical protein
MFTIPKKTRTKQNMNYLETRSDSFFKIDDVVAEILSYVNPEDILIPRVSKTLNEKFQKNKKKETVKQIKNLCMYTHIPYLSVIYDEMSFYDKNQFVFTNTIKRKIAI